MAATSSIDTPVRAVLLIGEETEQLRIAAGFLRQRGYAVATATDNATALRRARNTRPDLVLLDLTAGEVSDSCEVCHQLKADASIGPMPILIITRPLSDEAVSALAAGGDDFVTLPLRREELITRVDTCIRRYVWLKQQALRDIKADSARSAPRLSDLAANIPGFLYTFRLSSQGNCSFSFASDGVRELYGIVPEDVATDTSAIHSLVHPDDRSRIEEAFLRSAHDLSVLNVEFRIGYPLKGERWVECRSMPQREPDGGVLWHGVMFDIGARKAAEAALREREQRYRDVFNSVSDLLWLLSVTEDSRLQFIEVNPVAAKLIGLRRDEIVGRHTDELISAIPSPIMQCLLQRVQQEGTVVEEIELDVSHGGHTFDVTLIPLRDGRADRVSRVVCVARDITLRTRYENMLKEHAGLASKLHKLAAVAPGVIGDYLMTPDGNVTIPSALPRLEEITGWKCEDVMRDARLALRSIHPDDCEAHIASIEESGRTLNAWHSEFRVQHPEKGEIWIEGRSIPEREPDGSIRWYGFLHDVTERKYAEERLRASERHWRTLAENLPIFLVRFDRDGRYIYANSRFEQMTGVPAQDFLGKTPGEHSAIPASANTRVWEHVTNVLSSGSPSEFELEFESGNETVWHLLRIVPEFSAAGQLDGALVIGSDISVHKRMEQALRAFAKRREADLEEERKRIACELHDELGQQLVALRMNVNVLHIQFGNGESRMREATDRILALVDLLIQSTRDVSASLRPTMLDMGLVPALEWLTSRFERHIGMRCRLRVAQGEIAMTDEQAITIFRIVQESLTNAARHSKAKRIDVAFWRESNVFVVEVKDDGVGFDVEHIRKPNAFGLVGIRERALAAGGESIVVSEPRRGTAVRARIPAVCVTASTTSRDSGRI